MAFRLTPKEDGFYELFGISAGHLVNAAKELTNLLAVETAEERRAVVERLSRSGHGVTDDWLKRVHVGPGAPHGARPLVAACHGTRGYRGPTPSQDIAPDRRLLPG